MRRILWVKFVVSATLVCTSAKLVRAADVQTGIDVLEDDSFKELRGKKIGLITNQTGKDRQGRSTVDILGDAPGVELKTIFAPEHSFTGKLDAMRISSDTYKLPNGRAIPIYPSFGLAVPSTTVMYSGLDAVVFDMQDVGARFYTYATTMAMMMEAAAKYNLEFYVLDRPNPITGAIVEGPILDPDIHAFIAYFPISTRHGLTVGELARMYNTSHKLGAKLQVIPLKGWSRDMWYDQTGLPWTQPSPNMPDLDAAILYPGIECLRTTNISVGRGTPTPFRWIGAPWLNSGKVLDILKKANLAGVEFSEETQTPSDSPYNDKYRGQKCNGIRMRVTDRNKVRPLHIFAVLACALRDVHPNDFHLDWDGAPGATNVSLRFYLPTTHRLVGSEKFYELYKSGASPDKIIEMFDKSAKDFEVQRRLFLLY